MSQTNELRRRSKRHQRDNDEEDESSPPSSHKKRQGKSSKSDPNEFNKSINENRHKNHQYKYVDNINMEVEDSDNDNDDDMDNESQSSSSSSSSSFLQETSRHWSGPLDSDENYTGRGMLTITLKESSSSPPSPSTPPPLSIIYVGRMSQGMKHGRGTLTTFDGITLTGQWHQDTLNGRGSIYYDDDGNTTEGIFTDGVIEGWAVEKNQYGQVVYEGEYSQGSREGWGTFYVSDGGVYRGWWKEGEFHNLDEGEEGNLEDIGVKYEEGRGKGNGKEEEGKGKGKQMNGRNQKKGNVNQLENDTNNMIDENISSASIKSSPSSSAHPLYNEFIYPSLLPAPHPIQYSLRGYWSKNILRSSLFYSNHSLSDSHIPLSPQLYSSDISTHTSIAAHPLLPDPYESITCYVSQSHVNATGNIHHIGDGQEGLFARIPLPPFTIVSFYGGIKQDAHVTEDNEWEQNGNAMTLIEGKDERNGIDIDVPSPYDSTTHYQRTLGHKANHQFDEEKRTARYAKFLHPIYGFIKAVETVRKVERGEELTVDYGYKEGEGPEWYRKGERQYKERMAKEKEKEKGKGKGKEKENESGKSQKTHK